MDNHPVSIKDQDGVLTARLGSEGLVPAMKEILDASPVNMILDFSGTDPEPEETCRELLVLLKRIMAMDGRLLIRGAGRKLMNVMKQNGLSRAVELVEEPEDSAVKDDQGG